MTPTETNNDPNWLGEAEAKLWRRLNRAAGLLLLMLRLCRPLTCRQAAGYLDLHPKTTSEYFHCLQELGFIASARSNGGYQLVDELLDGQRIDDFFRALPEQKETQFTAACANFSRFLPILIIIDRLRIKNDSIIITGADGKKRTGPPGTLDQLRKPLQKAVRQWFEQNHFSPPITPQPDAEVLEALRQAGIAEPKRSKLALLPGMSARHVTAWEQQLRLEKKEKYNPGLLVHVLEGDLPTPACRSNGHVKSCECDHCGRLKYNVCLYCFQNPCICRNARSDGL